MSHGRGPHPVTDPNVLRVEILAALEDETAYLPYGRTGGPEVVPYRQHAGPACFYASQIAVQATHSGEPPINEVTVVDEARRQYLLLDSGMVGAQTTNRYWDAQTQFVREQLGLDIEFIDPHYPVPVVHRLIQAMIEKDQVLFGLDKRKHWVVIDGLKRAVGRGNVWTGMDPAGGQRIEYPSRVLQESLSTATMPLVVVRNPNVERPSLAGRFRSAQVRPRFAPARVQSAQPRFSGQVVRPSRSRFRPGGH